MPTIRLDRLMPGASVLLVLSLAACSGASVTGAPGSSTNATAVASAAASPAPAASPSSDATTGTQAGARVSANTATEAEIAAALAAAGVANADRWAREVVEYRPYAADDATLQKLQDNLAKYNPDPTTLAGILSALMP